MGLFSFFKNAGSKVKTESKPAAPTAPAAKEGMSDFERAGKLRLLKDIAASTKVDARDLDISLDGEVVKVRGEVDNQADKEKLVVALGNVHGIAYVDEDIATVNESAAADFYTVEKGDSLSKIAKAKLGDPMKYKEIFEANRPMLDNPDNIYPGQVLRIPRA